MTCFIDCTSLDTIAANSVCETGRGCFSRVVILAVKDVRDALVSVVERVTDSLCLFATPVAVLSIAIACWYSWECVVVRLLSRLVKRFSIPLIISLVVGSSRYS